MMERIFAPRQLSCNHENPHGTHSCHCPFVLFNGQQIPHFHCPQCSATVLLVAPKVETRFQSHEDNEDKFPKKNP